MSFSFDNFDRLTRQGVKVPLPTDNEGYLGRECPAKECEGVFKIKLGTGLTGDNLPCHCAYCGHVAAHDQFYTKEQIKYARSVAMREVSRAVREDLKKLEFEVKPPKHGFGTGVSVKLQPGRPIPLHRIQEPTLETQVTCSECGLDYAVFGLFAYCPDCGTHNSKQILARNLSLILKQLQLAADQESDLGRHLVEDALENCVSAFDGFGREVVRTHAQKSRDPPKCERLSFQNLGRASDDLRDVFGVDLSKAVPSADWSVLNLGFMRRHLLAHRSGVVDQRYLDETGEPNALLGRRLSVDPSSVEKLVEKVQDLGDALESLLLQLP